MISSAGNKKHAAAMPRVFLLRAGLRMIFRFGAIAVRGGKAFLQTA
ncbi:hypothetical protein [Chromobacterium violaceum]|nr:hypothetical protein [Chromobacterium violaceum]QRO31233.1 hypothetical protein I6K04_11865 [Chromobacterium violaceum]QRQ18966.1 hypothetical protein I6K03_10865 [Chromobacterium violaceum]